MKIKLPWDIKQECLWIVRGYSRRVKQYHELRQDVIESGGDSYTTYIHTDASGKSEQRRSYGGHGTNIGRPTEDKQSQLEAIEKYPETKKMKAVEHAKLLSSRDVEADEVRQRLINGIMLNIESGRNYPFEYLNLSEFSRMDFYRRKDSFVYLVATYLDMI